VANISPRKFRHEQILKILSETGNASVAELGELMGVTEMTIRRDLEALEESSAIKRFHGGAKLVAGSSYEPPIAVREQTNMTLKHNIAHSISNLIMDGKTLILDGGSTGIAIAESLIHHNITVCPLSLRVAWTLAKSSTVKLLMPSGVVRAGELSLSGSETNDYLASHHFDHFIMTASGFSIANGFTEWNLEDAGTKRAALASSSNTIAAIDSSKFDTVGFMKICNINVPNTIVIDDQLEKESLTALSKAAKEIIMVRSEF
jgi:DeoR/GlpR family transcriptional regulator of sugar metabolism